MIFIRFSLFCSENFTLSSEIKLDQLRTSLTLIIILIGNADFALVWKNYGFGFALLGTDIDQSQHLHYYFFMTVQLSAGSWFNKICPATLERTLDLKSPFHLFVR